MNESDIKIVFNRWCILRAVFFLYLGLFCAILYNEILSLQYVFNKIQDEFVPF